MTERKLDFATGQQDLAVYPPPHLTKPCCPDQWTSLPGAMRQTYPNKAASGHEESCKHGPAGCLLARSLVGGLDMSKPFVLLWNDACKWNKIVQHCSDL